MSEAKVRGVVHVIEETKTYGSKGFRKRLIVLEQEKGSFTNYVPLEFTRDDCDSVDSLNVGDEIEVSYRLSGRKWQRDATSEVKYFLNAEAISFSPVGGGGGGSTGGATNDYSPPASVNDAFAEVDDDEPPF
ncbi:DUF3127 domain-containing protein [Planctomycetaceae bacterium SH139]